MPNAGASGSAVLGDAIRDLPGLATTTIPDRPDYESEETGYALAGERSMRMSPTMSERSTRTDSHH